MLPPGAGLPRPIKLGVCYVAGGGKGTCLLTTATLRRVPGTSCRGTRRIYSVRHVTHVLLSSWFLLQSTTSTSSCGCTNNTAAPKTRRTAPFSLHPPFLFPS